MGKMCCSWLWGVAWGLWLRATEAVWQGILFWGFTVPALMWTRGVIRAQKAGKEMLFAAETGARQAREEEEELEVADEEEEGEGGSAYQRQRVDRGKGRGMSSKKRAASIAGRRRRATSAKQQNRVYDPGITG